MTLLQFPLEDNFSRNMIPLIIDTGLGFESYVLIEVWIENNYPGSGDWVMIGKERLWVGTDGKVETNLSSVYDAAFDKIIEPWVQMNVITQENKIIRKAKVVVQSYDDTALDDSFELEFRVWNGGIPQVYEKRFLPYLFLDILSYQPWFSWKPSVTVVSKRTPEFTFFKAPAGFTDDLLVRFEIVKDDGSTASVDVIHSCLPKDYDNNWIIPVGYNANDLDSAIAGYEPISYTVQLINKDSGDPFTGKRKYVIDHIPREFERFFIFLNSFGVPETLRTIGEASFKTQFEDNIISSKYDLEPYDLTAPLKNLDSSFQKSITINTGFVSKEHSDWLHDFRNARYVWEVEMENEEYAVPIIFLKKEFVPSKENQDLHALVFEYTKAFVNKAHSPVIQP